MDEGHRGSVEILELVCIVKALEGVGDTSETEAEWEVDVVFLGSSEDRREGLAVEVLHHHDVVAVDLGYFKGIDDVGVVESSCDSCFVEEHLECVGIVDEMDSDCFQYDEFAESGWSGSDGKEDFGHSSSAEFSE